MLRKIGSFLKRNLFLYTMFFSLALPDVVLRLLSGGFTDRGCTFATCFTLFWIALVILACTAFMSRSWGRGVYLTVSVLFAVVMISNYIYYRVFNQFYWLDNVGMTGQALEYTGYILQYVDWKLILAVAAEAFLIVVTFRRFREKPYRVSGLFLIVPILALVTLHTFMMTGGQAALSDVKPDKTKSIYYTFKDANRSMNTAGAYQYILRNVFRMIFPEADLEKNGADTVQQYFAEKPEATDNDMTGLLEGKNVIMVMMESIDDWMVDDTYTPTIRYMQKNGIDFTNHYACTFGTGYTFNTEFTANTGYHALTAGTPAASLSKNTYTYSLARAFRQKGYTARSFHFNTPDFYNRGAMHEAFGYEEYVCYQDYMPRTQAECDSAAIKSAKLYRKMVPEQTKPFFDFVVTYSAHLPYTYDDEKMRIIKAKYPNFIDVTMNTEINNAKILAHDTDEYFRILLEKLEREGRLEDTVIIAFADHFAYGLSSWEKLYKMSNAANSDMLERVPFFIYCAGMEPQQVKKVTNSLDILPTIVNLFRLEKTPYWMGEDAFDPAYGGYVYFSDGAWYNGNTYYFQDERVPDGNMDRQNDIDAMNEKFYRREKVNEIVLRTDYFKER